MKQDGQSFLSSKSLCNFLCLADIQTLPDELNLLLQRMKRISYRSGDVIIREGDIGDSFYLIDQGQVAVISEKEDNRRIGVIEEGDYFGELALLTSKPRTATIKATTDTSVFQLSRQDFEEITKRFPTINGTLLNKLYNRIKSAYNELEKKNEQLENLNRMRTQLASIFISVVLLITFYTFVLVFLHSDFIARQAFAGDIREYVSRGIEIVTLLIVIRMIINSRLPLNSFGVTLKGWKQSVLESVAVSVAVIVALFLFKMLANTYRPGIFKESQIVYFGYFGLSYVTYIVIAPLQEFITRGTVQSTLERLFTGRNSGFLAILVTSFLFGSLHVYSSIPLAVSALLTSWLWGWMYHRQETLIGVSLSHFLIGNAAGLMGYWTFF
jgi:CRP-like cAMP-binding protein